MKSNNQRIPSSKVCPNCKSKAFINTNGYVTCSVCGECIEAIIKQRISKIYFNPENKNQRRTKNTNQRRKEEARLMRIEKDNAKREYFLETCIDLINNNKHIADYERKPLTLIIMQYYEKGPMQLMIHPKAALVKCLYCMRNENMKDGNYYFLKDYARIFDIQYDLLVRLKISPEMEEKQ